MNNYPGQGIKFVARQWPSNVELPFFKSEANGLENPVQNLPQLVNTQDLPNHTTDETSPSL